MSRGETKLSILLGRRAIPAVAALIILSFVLMAALLVRIASQQDRAAAEQAAHSVRASLEHRREVIAKDIKDYAAWGEAYQHLHITTDTDWAFTKQNLGATLFHDLGYDRILVVGPQGGVTYAVVNGELRSPALPDLLPDALRPLVAEALAVAAGETKPKARYVSVGGTPLLAAATAITTGADPTIVPTPGPPSVLIFCDTLTSGRLAEIGTQGFVNGLRLDDKAAAETGSSLVLPAPDGELALIWDLDQPGHRLLRSILPWLSVAGIAFAVLAILILRRTIKIAALIEANAHALTEAHREAEHAALHDGTTELPNRLMLKRYLKRVLGDAGLGPLAVVFIDLDRFKPINDALGHRAGDQVLKIISARLRAAVKDTDIVARVGGDEFVLALRGHLSSSEIERFCGRLLATVGAPIGVEGTSIQVGLSVGIAGATTEVRDADELLRHADIAMYQAKIEGGNAFRFFSADMDKRISTRLKLESDLRRAIDAAEFVMHYQPRYESASMRLIGVEALLRWHHPQRGLVGPSDFIDIAEQTGLILRLGAWALRQACTTIAGYPDITVSVNVSPAQFRDPHLVDLVAAALGESGLPGTRLELEITENVLLEDTVKALDTLTRLKDLGVSLAMDDFGTGYSSLGYLQKFPFDRLKIDRQFVSELHPSGQGRAIVQAILGLGRALNLNVTAEGVETVEQLLLLRADHCDEVQGFHLSRPISDEQLTALLQPAAAARGRVATCGGEG